MSTEGTVVVSRRTGLVATAMTVSLLVLGGGWLGLRRARHRLWATVHDGYGAVTCVGDKVRLAPRVAMSPEQTHAALATSEVVRVQASTTTSFTATLLTNTQLRRGTEPNPWEVAWLLWCYQDDLHFYALVLKPNGWELSKEDPAYPGAQRFLASGHEPQFPVGLEYSVAVTVATSGENSTMSVKVDGDDLVTVSDDQSPYQSGRVAAYTEDADVTIGPVRSQLPSSESVP